MNNEDYVSFEQAKALKELGFDWGCYKFYYDNAQLEGYVSDGWHGDECRNWNDNFNSTIANAVASAPTLAQAQKWLRDVKGIGLNIIAHDGGLYHWESIFLPEGPEYDDFIGPDNRLFPNYEQALSASIYEALEFLKQHNNGK